MEVRPWAEIAVDSLGPLGSENRWRALTIIDTSTRLLINNGLIGIRAQNAVFTTKDQSFGLNFKNCCKVTA
ncbi:hypothetical protein PHMEG_00033631 [Phytophthora megakarya]|uniref:Uncharacterized protein n=1 Tax=Phytophthora megakarya TaxID=4795 RepID=A0A225UVE2_9STRA|nr:hypothetical protein PHMEG_00033631 [Phytophthora megakarya]